VTPDQLKRHEARLGQLDTERQSWMSHWQELAEQTGPRSFRYASAGDVNARATTAGAKQNRGIINNTPVIAARTLKAGMLSGMMSPSRPWFQLTLGGQEEAIESQGAKAWLAEVEDKIRETLLKSNFYSAALLSLHDLAIFGFTCNLMEEDEEDDVRCYVFPVGQYWLSQSDRLAVDTIYRRFTMTVRQLVKKFTIEHCSKRVKGHYQRHELETPIDVVHCIEPNEDFKEGALGPKGKPFLSTWWEYGCPASETEYGCLREGGYDEQPFTAPRWTTTGEDVYGTSPAMDALGDCRALQLAEKRAAEMVDKIVTPPMRGPKSLTNQRVSLLPGGMTYVDALSPSQAFGPAMEVNPQSIAVAEAKIREFEQRINRAFYADLWLMLQQTDGQMTAREVIERREEKLLQLGPVLDRMHDEFLDPAINRTFNILLRRGKLPPPPEELQGRDLKVKFISIMAQAQKLQGTTAVERLSGFVAQLAPLRADLLDKINWDATVDEYGGMLGVAPKIINTQDMVEGVRKHRAKMQAQAAKLQAAEQMSGAAKNLAGADMSGENALTSMLKGVGAA